MICKLLGNGRKDSEKDDESRREESKLQPP